MKRRGLMWLAAGVVFTGLIAGAAYAAYAYVRDREVQEAFASGSLQRVAGLPPTICASSRPDIKGKTEYSLRIYDGRIRLDEYRTASKELSRIRIYRDRDGLIYFDAKAGARLPASDGASAGAREILGGPWECRTWYGPSEEAFQDERGPSAEWVML